jgi:hypothetical protein
VLQGCTSHRVRRNGITIGGISTLGLGVLFASNCAGLRNITLHRLQALSTARRSCAAR